MRNVRAVVLAAGEGTRMKSKLSKLLHLHPISSQALLKFTGDAPFITSSMLIELIEYHRETKPAATVLTALLSDPGYYGRIVRNGYRNGYRQLKKIVESKDASSEELKIKEVNSGIYCFDTQKILPLLSCLHRDNKKREYYLTDVVELLNERGLRVEAMRAQNPQVVLGVNTPEELKRAWRILEEKAKVQ